MKPMMKKGSKTRIKLYFNEPVASFNKPIIIGHIHAEAPPVICKNEKNVVSKP
jgi:hypothetical protein